MIVYKLIPAPPPRSREDLSSVRVNTGSEWWGAERAFNNWMLHSMNAAGFLAYTWDHVWVRALSPMGLYSTFPMPAAAAGRPAVIVSYRTSVPHRRDPVAAFIHDIDWEHL